MRARRCKPTSRGQTPSFTARRRDRTRCGWLMLASTARLDVAGAEAPLRHAIRIALPPSGRPSYAAKLAGSVLGELLYERGQLDEAEALLDAAYELGAEGGLVAFMSATFGTGARL